MLKLGIQATLGESLRFMPMTASRAGLIRMEQLIAEVSANPMRQLIAEAVNVVVCIENSNGSKIKEIITVDGFKNGEYTFSICQ